jgi:hypothetical protein
MIKTDCFQYETHLFCVSALLKERCFSSVFLEVSRTSFMLIFIYCKYEFNVAKQITPHIHVINNFFYQLIKYPSYKEMYEGEVVNIN